MPKRILPSEFIEPCLPTVSTKVPVGPRWLYEIKHDGYRFQVKRDDEGVRIYSRNGYDWTRRFPLIVKGANQFWVKSITLDGEGVVYDDDGIADFAKLHSRKCDDQVILYAFDLLELNGKDMRREPLETRRNTLQTLFTRVSHGIQFSEHLDGNGHEIFQHVCQMGLEGIVAKLRDSPYQSGRSAHWVKIKNPASPAMKRHDEEAF